MRKLLELDGAGLKFKPKEAFKGQNGHVLMCLQDSYVGDQRFDLDGRFKGDIDYQLLPEELKEKYVKRNNGESEQTVMMGILAKIAPGTQRIEPLTAPLQVTRFDPAVGGAVKLEPLAGPGKKTEKKTMKMHKRERRKPEKARKAAPMRKVSPRVSIDSKVFIKSSESPSQFRLFSSNYS